MDVVAVASAFVFGYPVIMAYLWMVGGVYFHLHRERDHRSVEHPPPLATYPLVSVLVPCHNEGPNVVETLTSALESSYPNLEVIAVNDGSTDDTAQILDELITRQPRLRVVHLAGNQGKGVALRTAALAARSDYLVCIDGDALLDEYAVHWMVFHLSTGARVGAVTGNPRIRNRGSLLGRASGWRVLFDHRADQARPSNLRSGVYRLRRDRGVPAHCSRRRGLLGSGSHHRRHRYLVASATAALGHPIRASRAVRDSHARDSARSVAAAAALGSRRGAGVACASTAVASLATPPVVAACPGVGLEPRLGGHVGGPDRLEPGSRGSGPRASPTGAGLWEPTWYTVVLASTCLIQFAVSLVIDRQFDRGMMRSYFWIIWYPLAFWLIGWLTCLTALPSMLRRRTARAVWVSADRGLQHDPSAAIASGSQVPVARRSQVRAGGVVPGGTPLSVTAEVPSPVAQVRQP